jgi:copper transport protein
MLDALAALAQITLYIGILCASGAVFAHATLRAQGDCALVLNDLARTGAILTILATLGGVIVLVFRLSGQFDEPTIAAILMSSVGAAGGMRLIAALMLLATPSMSGDTFSHGMRLSYAALLAASFLFIGHAATAGFGAGLMASVHVSMAGWWIASLIVMERACRSQNSTDISVIVRRFSKIAVGAIALLVVAGIVLILALVAWPIEVTPYLATLGAKLAIALAVFALAAYNKFRLTPRLLQGDVVAVSALHRSIALELLLIGAVIVATTLMTTYNAPEG